jgi:toxin YoeB
MRICFTANAWTEYCQWQETDRKTLKRINHLIRDIQRDTNEGIGKPEPLKGKLSGWWSRRITGEHRLIYRVVGEGETRQIEIAQCMYHY